MSPEGGRKQNAKTKPAQTEIFIDEMMMFWIHNTKISEVGTMEVYR